MPLPRLIDNSKYRRFICFCLVGTIGFILDAAVLKLGLWVVGDHPLLCRIPSFALAVLVTWYGNARWTFRIEPRFMLGSFPKYMASNLMGLAMNYGLYTLCIVYVPFCASNPLSALAIASIGALAFNFIAAQFWIFKPRNEP